MGGYLRPSRSTCGAQVQRSAAGMASMTRGTCRPQPHQVDFSGDGGGSVSLMMMGKRILLGGTDCRCRRWPFCTLLLLLLW